MGTKTILVIDDDKLILESLSKIFIRDNWTVELCQNGKEGLEKIKHKPYDCVLLDIRMPDINGAQVLTQLREDEKIGTRKQNVIIMTGYADDEATLTVFQLGVFGYINKPFDLDVVLEKTNSCASATKVTNAYDELSLENEEKEFKKIRKLYDRQSVEKKADIIAHKTSAKLVHIKSCSYDTEFFRGNIENPIGIIQIPLGIVGPVEVKGQHAVGEFLVPMATTEGALLLTYDLGSRLLSMAEPVYTEILNKVVHITPMFPIISDEDKRVEAFVASDYQNIKRVAEGQSSHTKLLDIERKRIGSNYLLKFKYDTGDAQGLNMINQASYNACKYIQSKTGANFYHRSHYSGVKHHSLLNEREGYGRKVLARGIISSKALAMLHVSAEKMKDFFDRCRECGGAAEISSVNVHAANALAAIYMACGQDAADISSAHVCDTKVMFADDKKSLVIELVLKNLLVATVGGGTGLGTQSECLNIMGCLGSGKSDKFAEIIAATTLAGEFPTAAAVISETYVDIHNKYGRNKTSKTK